MMKHKFGALFIAAMMALTLTACGNSSAQLQAKPMMV